MSYNQNYLMVFTKSKLLELPLLPPQSQKSGGKILNPNLKSMKGVEKFWRLKQGHICIAQRKPSATLLPKLHIWCNLCISLCLIVYSPLKNFVLFPSLYCSQPVSASIFILRWIIEQSIYYFQNDLDAHRSKWQAITNCTIFELPSIKISSRINRK